MQASSTELVIGYDWIADQVEGLTDTVEVLRVSQWAEGRRYLPMPNRYPGPFRFDVAPYMREIADCMSVESPVREVALMKGVQVTATVGVLENTIGYYIEHVKSMAMMMVTADSELAQLRMDTSVMPMIQASDMDHLIQSQDSVNTRKTGATSKKLEFYGGGQLIPLGAKNANKMRSLPIQILLRDEVDGWPDVVGRDGDPMQLTFDRTSSYEQTRKVLDLSTPLIKGKSKIQTRFERGDQRYYFVRCLSCGYSQVLRWRTVDEQTGEITGIIWETEGGILVPESVRYLCVNCGHEHYNEDKIKLLDPDNGAEWKPTASPVSPYIRSYHLSGLYSPVGFKSWASQVQHWLEAWDVDNSVPRDIGHLQVFYNNVLGEPFEVFGEKILFRAVSAHRRQDYRLGEIPNRYAIQYCDSPILFLTCQVDVQKENLAVSVKGWAKDQRVFVIDYWRFEGETDDIENPDTWGRVQDLIENKVYISDDGKKYNIALTLVDSGYMTDHVYTFCSQYETGVFPIKGRELPPKSAQLKEFSPFTSTLGTIAFGITVDIYKDRWATRLRKHWDMTDHQPTGCFNAPVDMGDKQLAELTKETKREKKHAATGRVIGHEWHRAQGAKNELWDLLMYATAAHDMIMLEVCRDTLGLEQVNPAAFYEVAEEEKLFYSD